MAMGIQIIGLLFALVMVYMTFLNFKRKEFTVKESLFWVILWIVFIIAILVPKTLSYITGLLDIARVFDFFIVLGLMFLIGANYYTYSIVRGNQKRIEKIVRKVAMEKEK